MNCIELTTELFAITYSPKSTTTVIHCLITQHRAQFATWVVDQQSSWFQQEYSVRTAGPPSTQDTWPQRSVVIEDAAATFAGTRHRKSQLAEYHKTKHRSTLLKSFVDHYRVHSIPLAENWRAPFALNDVCIKTMFKSKLCRNTGDNQATIT